MINLRARRGAALTLAAAIWLPAAFAGPRDDVMNVDREFAKFAAAQGNRAAFLLFAAPDAMMFQPGVGPVKGQDAIGASFDEPDGLLEWWPEDGIVAANGDLAYTWGYWRYTAKENAADVSSTNATSTNATSANAANAGNDGAKKNKVATGNYVTIWRKLGGRWKWVVDLGVAAPLPAAAPK